MTRQYIGARYVPKFFDNNGSTEWVSGFAYEALTIVTRNGNSYTSKIPVPAEIGAPETNPQYWAATGLYNQQISELSTEVTEVKDNVDSLATDLDEFKADGAIGNDNLAENSVSESKLDTLLRSKLKNCRVLGHRGYPPISTYAQDNSQLAYVGAFMVGFGGFECDVRKDANGVIVCLHDDNVNNVSNTTGNIANLPYTDILYKNDEGATFDCRLCTLKDAIEIAKLYDGFIMFDMGKGVVSVNEIARICEAAEFYSYGLFNVSTETALSEAPDYVIKVWGNDVFTHTQSELEHYLSYGTKNNAVRILATNNLDEQINLIKSMGFKIVMNYDYNLGFNIINNIDKIDYMMSDYIPYQVPNDTFMHSGVLQQSVRLVDYINSLPNNAVRSFQMQTQHADNTTGTSLQCTLWKQGSNNYAEILGASIANDSAIYKLVINGGVMYDWVRISDPHVMLHDGVLDPGTSLQTFLENMDNNSMRSFQIQTTHPDNDTGNNLQCMIWKQSSNNFAEIIGISVNDDNLIYKKVVNGGVWYNWRLCSAVTP